MNCEGAHIPISIKGKLSDNPQTPGFLHENAALFNHTISPLDPNMIFQVIREDGPKSPIIHLIAYACLGKILGKEEFSFNLISRDHTLDEL